MLGFKLIHVSKRGHRRHDMEMLSSLLAFSEVKPSVTGAIPNKVSVMRSFCIFFVLSFKQTVQETATLPVI